MANVVKVKTYDIANGPAIRTSVFFSGCDFGCKGCFNKDIQDFSVGEPFSREYYETRIKPTINEHIAGISILGGEPLHPNNIDATRQLVEWFRNDFPDKTIWLWTGYEYNELLERALATDFVYVQNQNGINVCKFKTTLIDSYCTLYILNNIDVLVDGRFIEEQKDLTLKWRGSKNQRVILVEQSLKQGKVILYND